MDTPTILVINPNTSEEMTAAIDRVGQAAAASHARVVTLCSRQGPHTIEGALDAALGTAGMLERVAAYPEPFDAVVVACFGDPGVDALRMRVSSTPGGASETVADTIRPANNRGNMRHFIPAGW